MMKRTRPLIWLLALGLAIVTTGLVAAPRAEIYPDVPTAVLQTDLDLTGLITIQPVAYRQGVATYRLQQVGSDAQRLVSVAAAYDPRLAPPPDTVDEKLDAQRTAELAAYNRLKMQKGFVVTNSNALRCDVEFFSNINLSVSALRTNLDFNNYSFLSNSLNDSVSSMRTGCNATVVFANKTWGGTSLFVAANTTVNNLGTFGLDNKISSHYLVCP